MHHVALCFSSPAQDRHLLRRCARLAEPDADRFGHRRVEECDRSAGVDQGNQPRLVMTVCQAQIDDGAGDWPHVSGRRAAGLFSIREEVKAPDGQPSPTRSPFSGLGTRCIVAPSADGPILARAYTSSRVVSAAATTRSSFTAIQRPSYFSRPTVASIGARRRCGRRAIAMSRRYAEVKPTRRATSQRSPDSHIVMTRI